MLTIVLTVAATLLAIYVIGFAVVLLAPRHSFSPVPRIFEAVIWPMMIVAIFAR